MSLEHVDVLIVGAGLSGIGAAHHLQERCPGRSYAILEAREDIGGTWDLFRYPGIRSDSDMHTLGYRFRPWTEAKSIADGPSILRYVRDTAREGGIDRHIRLRHRVVDAEWSSAEVRWTVRAERTDTGETVTMTCGFLFVNSGYYRYDQGYTPEFAGLDRFAGEVVHPQHWPEQLDYAGKRVVVIGSGATAMTLVPALAKDAAKVTMLQRSPTYVVSMPGEDGLAKGLRRFLPDRAVYPLVRWKNVFLQGASYRLSRRRPELMKKLLRRGVMKALPPGYDVDTHFKPRYDPWDQRLCLVPDADLFQAIHDGSAEIVTDRIETFTEHGIELESGAELEADIVITATGLNLLFLGGMRVAIDGEEPDLVRAMTYKGMMLSDLPNFAYTLGYTNASWTLKADLTSEYVCRLLNHMDAGGYRQCVPRVTDPSVTEEPLLSFSSGYVLRSIDQLPKQGSKEPWKLRQNYPIDLRALRFGPIDDGVMQFSNPDQSARISTTVSSPSTTPAAARATASAVSPVRHQASSVRSLASRVRRVASVVSLRAGGRSEPSMAGPRIVPPVSETLPWVVFSRMDDQQVLSRIDELVQEEEALLHRHEGENEPLTLAENARLEELKVQLDQAWDYLRQRRALRQYGENPDEASPRDPGTVENYEG